MTTRVLNIGAGRKQAEGEITLDVSTVYGPDMRGDALRLPFAANRFDRVVCHHVLEHLPREHLVQAMNEMWVVLRPGGIADIEVPVFPYWTAMADPTHVSFFVPQTFDYFLICRRDHEHGEAWPCLEDKRRLYGIRPWELVARERHSEGSILRVWLRKVEE